MAMALSAYGKDWALASSLFARACDGGHDEACGYLGNIHRAGLGTPMDHAKAVPLLVRACHASFGRFCDIVGENYEHGMGLPTNLGMAARYYRAACILRDERGCSHLEAAVVAADNQPSTLAARLFLSGCKQGDKEACDIYAFSYLWKSCDQKDGPRCIEVTSLNDRLLQEPKTTSIPRVRGTAHDSASSAGSGSSSLTASVHPAPTVGIPRSTPTSGGSGATALQPPCPAPSYDVTSLRWERFPILVYIEQPELTRRGYSSNRTSQIVQLIMKGLGSWADATGQRVGAIQRVADHKQSQVNVVFRNGTGNTIHDSVQGEFIRHATIMMDIMRNESFGAPFPQTYEGRSFTDGADHRIVNTAAHEMGHVLGIVQHPESSGSLMIGSPEQLFYEAPQTIDVNSVMKKYGACGNAATPGPTRTSLDGPPPLVQAPPARSTASVPFAGRWQCTVYGSEALMNQFLFTVNDDGTVFLAGLAEEPQAAITSSSIQFESRDSGIVDSTSLRGGSSRLDGTRTLTIPGTPTVSHRISCVPTQRR